MKAFKKDSDFQYPESPMELPEAIEAKKKKIEELDKQLSAADREVKRYTTRAHHGEDGAEFSAVVARRFIIERDELRKDLEKIQEELSFLKDKESAYQFQYYQYQDGEHPRQEDLDALVRYENLPSETPEDFLKLISARNDLEIVSRVTKSVAKARQREEEEEARNQKLKEQEAELQRLHSELEATTAILETRTEERDKLQARLEEAAEALRSEEKRNAQLAADLRELQQSHEELQGRRSDHINTLLERWKKSSQTDLADPEYGIFIAQAAVELARRVESDGPDHLDQSDATFKLVTRELFSEDDLNTSGQSLDLRRAIEHCNSFQEKRLFYADTVRLSGDARIFLHARVLSFIEHWKEWCMTWLYEQYKRKSLPPELLMQIKKEAGRGKLVDQPNMTDFFMFLEKDYVFFWRIVNLLDGSQESKVELGDD